MRILFKINIQKFCALKFPSSTIHNIATRHIIRTYARQIFNTCGSQHQFIQRPHDWTIVNLIYCDFTSQPAPRRFITSIIISLRELFPTNYPSSFFIRSPLVSRLSCLAVLTRAYVLQYSSQSFLVYRFCPSVACSRNSVA